jgi:putative ABC transport system permease protein
MVLSYGLWQRRYAADPGVLGRAVNYNGAAHTVIGVLTRDFDLYGRANANNDIFLPLSRFANAPWMQRRDSHLLAVLGRLRPEVALSRARDDLAAINDSLARAYPSTNEAIGVEMRTLLEDYVGDVRLALSVLVGAAALVLAAACGNVANLLLARAISRRREIAMRLALGASRGRIVRQIMTEALLLAALGGIAGTAAGSWATRLLQRVAAGTLPRLVDAAFDWRVALFAVAITSLAGIVFGSTPAWQLRSTDARQLLHRDGRGSAGAGTRVREALVVAQVALCMALLVAAGLLLKTVRTLTHVDPGYVARNVVSLRVRLPDARYRDRVRVLAFLRELLPRVSDIDGVESACLTTGVPLGRATDERFVAAGQPPSPDNQLPVAIVQWVSPDCHRTFGITLLAGRYFAASDREGSADVAIVDEDVVRRFFGGQQPRSALGQRVRLVGEGQRWRTIVGVVRHIRHAALDEQPRPEIYVPFEQTDAAWQLEIGRAMDIAVRGSGDPQALVARVRKQVQGIDPELPLSHVRTLSDAVSESVAPRVFNLALLSAFAGTALVLCVLGVYAVMSYSVTQRTREIGIRMALGAQRSDVVGLVLSHGMRAVALGVVLGLGGAVAAARLLHQLLYGVTPRDPFTLVSAAMLLTSVALVACYVPARRAVQLDPATALRNE